MRIFKEGKSFAGRNKWISLKDILHDLRAIEMLLLSVVTAT